MPFSTSKPTRDQSAMGEIFSLLLAVLLLYIPNVNGECNGVGNVVEGSDVCNCTNSFPDVGESGWTGEACNIRVYGASLDSTDMTLACRQEDCHVLQGNNATCFAAHILWRDFNEPWNFLAIQLTRSSESGDPDLYGIFTGGPSSQNRIPTLRESGYDFMDISSRSHVSTVKKVEKREYGLESDYTGLYLCAKPYGGAQTKFELRGQATLCPSGYLDDGTPTMCSTTKNGEGEQRRYSECTSDGVCDCEGVYSRPEGSAIEGVGFEDCSARVTMTKESEFRNSSYTAWHIHLPGGYWDYYAFNVSSTDYHIVARAILEAGSEGNIEIYARKGEPPGKSYPDYSLRSAFRNPSGEDPLIQMKRGDAEFREGLWYIGAYSAASVTSSYSIKISKFICTNDCNHNGECELHSDGINKCNCHRGYFLEDCAATGRNLEYNKVYDQEETNMEYEFFQLPKMTPLSNGNNIEITIEAQYESSYFPSFASTTPELVILEGGSQDYPTLENYTYKVELKEQGVFYSIGLCPSVLAGGNLWRAAIYNPIASYPMGYTLKLHRRVHCLNDCSGNGDCDDNGTCLCRGNFAGGDCSVDVSTSGCIDESRISGRILIDHGTCWQTCRCKTDEGCHFEEDCSEVTCDEGWSFSKHIQECVQDQCTDSTFHITEDYFCVRPCRRLAHGPSRLSSGCDPRTFHCRKGTKVFDRSGSPYCTGACAENSLQALSAGTANNAHSFAPCVCNVRGTEGKVCNLLHNTVVLHCEDGYILRGGDAIRGSKFKSGGKCVKVSEHGMAGWAILLIVLSMLIVGSAIGAVAAKKTAGKSIFETMQKVYYEKMRGRSSSFEPNEY